MYSLCDSETRRKEEGPSWAEERALIRRNVEWLLIDCVLDCVLRDDDVGANTGRDDVTEPAHPC